MNATFTLQEVLTATGGRLAGSGCHAVFAGISTDTRTLQPGQLFIALSGERFDGHEYIPAALQKGAAGIIAASGKPLNGTTEVPWIEVISPLAALQALARFHRLRFTVPIIAVTGSNGKTSTKDMISAVLSTRLRILKTEANYNNEIGLSQTLLQLDETHQAVVVEMGMRGRGEIATLAAIALPTVGVVTNVGETHLERLGSIDNIAAAKAELIEALTEGGTAVLNADDARVAAMQSLTQAKILTYGVAHPADVKAERIQQQVDGVRFECDAGERRKDIFVPVPGIHTVYNALAAIAAGQVLGIGLDDAAQGLREYLPGKMRLNIQRHGSITVIDDTYNASPLSMSAAIQVLSEVAPGRKLAVIGDMLELGAAGRSAHEAVGRQLAEIGSAVVITVGELAAFAAGEATSGGVREVIVCQNHEQAAAELKNRLLPDDTVLVKGSRGMRMENILTVFSTEGKVE